MATHSRGSKSSETSGGGGTAIAPARPIGQQQRTSARDRPFLSANVLYLGTSPLNHGQETMPAVINALNGDGTVSLAILGRNGFMTVDRVPFAEHPTLGCWSWPIQQQQR